MLVEMGARPVSTGSVGGRLCLDFVNTVHNYRSDDPRDDIPHYSELVAWSRRADVVDDTETRSLHREASQRPAEALAAMEKARDLRRTLYRIFSAVVQSRPVGRKDLAILNEALSDALVQTQVIFSTEGFAWSWSQEDRVLSRVLWPIARSAADLLTSGELSRLRQCGGDNCTWLFLDTSKNHSRRWCEMKVCGNRVKARRHYERSRSRRSSRKGQGSLLAETSLAKDSSRR